MRLAYRFFGMLHAEREKIKNKINSSVRAQNRERKTLFSFLLCPRAKEPFLEKDKKQEGRSAIELAILNGIEAYNREQAKKNAGAAAKSEEKQDAKLFGKEAMEEAGLKPKRRSRARARGPSSRK